MTKRKEGKQKAKKTPVVVLASQGERNIRKE